MISVLERGYYWYKLECEILQKLETQFYLTPQCYCLRKDSINMYHFLDSAQIPQIMRSMVEWRFQEKYDSIVYGLNKFLDDDPLFTWPYSDPMFYGMDTIPEYFEVYNRTQGAQISEAQVKEIVQLIEF